MNTHLTPNDALLAEYTLGLLSPREMQQAHALLAEQDDAVATALGWEERLLALTDLLTPVDPSPLVLQRIQNSLGHDTTPPPSTLYRQAEGSAQQEAVRSAVPRQEPIIAPPPEVVTTPAAPEQQTAAPQPPGPAASSPARSTTPDTSNASDRTPTRRVTHKKVGNIWYWRLSTLGLAGVALVMGLAPAKPTAPPVTILEVAPTQAAILQAPGQSSTPAWVVTIDHQQNVHMMPQVSTDVPPNASVQLWTYTSSMPQPRSLGIVDPNRPVTVPAELLGGVSPGQIFEMTLESQGGSRSAEPAGPILYIGRVVSLGAAPPVNTTPATASPLSTPPR